MVDINIVVREVNIIAGVIKLVARIVGKAVFGRSSGLHLIDDGQGGHIPAPRFAGFISCLKGALQVNDGSCHQIKTENGADRFNVLAE
ncbi:hypothetical protein D3C76_1145010 [compost metagenome]